MDIDKGNTIKYHGLSRAEIIICATNGFVQSTFAVFVQLNMFIASWKTEYIEEANKKIKYKRYVYVCTTHCVGNEPCISISLRDIS